MYLCDLNFLYMSEYFHPWHSAPVGKNPPEIVNGIIEIPRGSKAKYEIDKETGLLMLDRVLYTSMEYPVNYGFIPQTLCGDGDPLDILVISQVDILPRSIVPARVIGVMRMIDSGDTDDKILAVPIKDMRFQHYKDIGDIPEQYLEELRHFFQTYKQLENKITQVQGFLDKKMAFQIIEENLSAYKAAGFAR